MRRAAEQCDEYGCSGCDGSANDGDNACRHGSGGNGDDRGFH
jgi:hypothetical protein